jgi:hypothetical protein
MKAGLLSFRDDFSERWVCGGKMLPELAILKLGSLNSRVQGVVEPVASFVAHVDGRARTIYVERSVHCSFAYSALASFRMGMFESASFQIASLYNGCRYSLD